MPGDPALVIVNGSWLLRAVEPGGYEPSPSGFHVLFAQPADGDRLAGFLPLALRVPSLRRRPDTGVRPCTGLLDGKGSVRTDRDAPLRAADPDLDDEHLAAGRI